MFETTTKLSMLFQVLGLWLLVHLKEYFLDLDLRNSNWDYREKQENKKQ